MPSRIIQFCVFFFILSNAAAQTVNPLPTVEDFMRNPNASSAKLAPDAQHVAALVAAGDNRMGLVVIDLPSKKGRVVGGFNDADIVSFAWVNNKRLIFSIADMQAAQGDTYKSNGLYAVDIDGKNSRILVPRKQPSMLVERKLREDLHWSTFLHSVIHGKETNEVILAQPNYNNVDGIRSLKLLRMNTMDGKATPLSIKTQDSIKAWVVDAYGEPRAGVAFAQGKGSVHFRDIEQDKWEKLTEFNLYQDDGFQPYALTQDGAFYVTSRGDKDKTALYRYDIANRKIHPDPVVTLKDYDFEGSLIYDNEKKRVVGVRYEADAEDTLWLDKEMKEYQTKVDSLLPGTINQIYFGSSSKAPFFLVNSSSDRQPTHYFLFDKANGTMDSLARSHPQINASNMGTTDLIHYKAGDGLDIPAYLTMPKASGKKNLPMVVLVHGGPFVRGGHWRWDSDRQFLVSRGYAVLEPDFRGSTGYGFKHFVAGWKQWGLAMQDDVADGAKWAISQGIADPKRICIAGASYGGYATLMGLINNPDLFRCGINWVGVTDINLMFSIASSDLSADWLQYGMPTLVGDPDKNAEQFQKTSPLQNADKIKQPLLLAYGGSDYRVPIAHGTKFRDAVKKHNQNVEWIEYPEEGHGWQLVKNRVDFWGRVEKFLGKHIGQQ